MPLAEVLPLRAKEVADYLRPLPWPEDTDIESVLRRLAEQPEGHLATAGEDGTVRLWDLPR